MNRRQHLHRFGWSVGALTILVAIAVGCTFGGDAASEEPVPAAAPVVDDREFEGCYECHPNIDANRSTVGKTTLNLDHAEHEDAAGPVACISCHPLETHVGKTTIRSSMDACFACHGANAEAPLNCSSCHPPSAIPSPLSHLNDEWGTTHGIPVLGEEIACTTCHAKTEFCSACHGVDMPHPEGWGEGHVDALEVDGEGSCVLCHSAESTGSVRSDCDTCHHPDGGVVDPWIATHASVARVDGTQECDSCHSQEQFCTACHGFEMPHSETWAGTEHALAFIEDDGDGCSTCHDAADGNGVRTECDSCHHPGGDPEQRWIMAHRGAATEGGGACFTCHAPATCVRCHADGVKDLEADWARVLESGD
ncbi:MAG: hypothetical protein ABFS21_02850 [Actinomycetota bacterium]